ncbi:hypothetical protein MRS44_016977 [Fusarium solani]|uniref:uncharacterized protein n=1 Tax=Fusarium solani TaxID=169388 RepID=UPI0032C48C48|nr:hypothetical protein MRS44_016977 [Fusarium solani]
MRRPTLLSETNLALIHFGSNAKVSEIDPNQAGFGSVLVAGGSHAVLSLKKSENEPEPLVFLGCHPNVLDQPKHETQAARAVYRSEVPKAPWLRCPINVNRTH